MARLISIRALQFKNKGQWHRAGHNTKFYSPRYGSFSFMYHSTNVVMVHTYSSGAMDIEINTGGWFSTTSAQRIRHALDAVGLQLLTTESFYNRKGEWRVADYAGNAFTIRGSKLRLFVKPDKTIVRTDKSH